MKIIQCTQGDDMWAAARLGIATASEFKRIITPTAKRNPKTNSLLSAQADAYAYRLIAETLLQRSMDSLEGLEWIEFGKANEADARKRYEFEEEVTTTQVGFITTDDGSCGASPDSLIGDDGILEIKCVAPQTQVAYLIEGAGDDYKIQLQGQLYVCERDWRDLFTYNPEMPSCKFRGVRDEAFIKLLAEALDEFNTRKADMLERIRVRGFFAERERIQRAAEVEYGSNLSGIPL